MIIGNVKREGKLFILWLKDYKKDKCKNVKKIVIERKI